MITNSFPEKGVMMVPGGQAESVGVLPNNDAVLSSMSNLERMNMSPSTTNSLVMGGSGAFPGGTMMFTGDGGGPDSDPIVTKHIDAFVTSLPVHHVNQILIGKLKPIRTEIGTQKIEMYNLVSFNLDLLSPDFPYHGASRTESAEKIFTELFSIPSFGLSDDSSRLPMDQYPGAKRTRKPVERAFGRTTMKNIFGAKSVKDKVYLVFMRRKEVPEKYILDSTFCKVLPESKRNELRNSFQLIPMSLPGNRSYFKRSEIGYTVDGRELLGHVIYLGEVQRIHAKPSDQYVYSHYPSDERSELEKLFTSDIAAANGASDIDILFNPMPIH